jgi:hypothetical protein
MYMVMMRGMVRMVGDYEGDDEGNGEDECVNDDDEGNGEDDCDDEDSDDVDYNKEDGDSDEDMEESDQPEIGNVGGSTHTAHRAYRAEDGAQLLEDEEEDDVSSKMARSDVLLSPPANDDENEAHSRHRCVPKVSKFVETDMDDPKLEVGQRFIHAKQFREAVRTFDLLKGKDVQFTKNDGDRVIGICRSRIDGFPWRVYGSLVDGEMTFMIKSFNPTHRCTRKYKYSIVTSRWIANRMIHKFRVQPNYPLKALYEDVKEKWNVDVSQTQLYKARHKARQQIEGKRIEQYKRLWDYCETVRKTNNGSCMHMKVERPTIDIPPRFLRLYMCLAACKDGFRAAGRLVIGLDGFFLKGHYKGKLLTAIGRDSNDNIYPIAIVVVESECRDSWSWFLETLVVDLEPAPNGLRGWTFIFDRQKVCCSCMVTLT